VPPHVGPGSVNDVVPSHQPRISQFASIGCVVADGGDYRRKVYQPRSRSAHIDRDDVYDAGHEDFRLAAQRAGDRRSSCDNADRPSRDFGRSVIAPLSVIAPSTL
jgi:hypothetical protein